MTRSVLRGCAARDVRDVKQGRATWPYFLPNIPLKIPFFFSTAASPPPPSFASSPFPNMPKNPVDFFVGTTAAAASATACACMAAARRRRSASAAAAAAACEQHEEWWGGGMGGGGTCTLSAWAASAAAAACSLSSSYTLGRQRQSWREVREGYEGQPPPEFPHFNLPIFPQPVANQLSPATSQSTVPN